VFDKLGKAITISRPLFWLGPFAAYAAGVTLAGVERDFFVLWEMLLVAFPLSFAIYAINDYFDMETDAKNPRKKGGLWGRALQREDVPWVAKTIFILAALAVATAIISFNPVHALLIAGGLIMPVIYSAPPIRLKNIPIVDSLANAAYVFFPFAAGAALGGSWIFLDWRFFVILLNVSAVHAITTIMDVHEDRKAGENTFAVAFGPRAPALFAFAIFTANLAIFAQFSSFAFVGLALACLLCAYLSVRPTPENARGLFKILFAYAILAGYYLMMKYALVPSMLADYSEAEFKSAVDGCLFDGSLPEGICSHVRALNESCSTGSEPRNYPGVCDALFNQHPLATT
jgi:4-hydroxybenzoate polyprenyltransferase